MCLWVSGCTQWRVLEECRVLADKVNTAADHIEEVQKTAPAPEAYETIANQYDQLALALSMMPQQDPELGAVTTDYVALLGKLSTNTRAHAKALAAKNRRKTAATRASGEKYAHEVPVLKRRIERVCHPR